MALAAATLSRPPAASPFQSSPFSPAPFRLRISVLAHQGLSKPQFYCSPSPLLSFVPCRNYLHHRLLWPCSVSQEAVTEVSASESVKDEQGKQKLRLYVANLPWNFSATEIEGLFGQCGTVKDVDIIKQKNGRSRGFSFVTMSSPEEAQAAINKFDSYELLQRIIRVDYAKSLTKPTSPPPEESTSRETRHLIFVSNLAWKVRASHIRELFSVKFKPVSARMVFDSPSGKSAGYGFVSFATQEEMEAAITELDGKELMGRPLRLKISERKGDKSSSKEEVIINANEPVEAT